MVNEIAETNENKYIGKQHIGKKWIVDDAG
jgi:hypothetical protein